MERTANGRVDPAPSSGEQTNLTAQTASGLSWFYLSTMTLMVANLAYTATVSRLLSPADFGLMAVANLVVLFIQFFARMGLASALVQKPELSEEEIRAASTAGIAIGLACLVLMWILAPAVAGLFREPDLPPILRALGVSFVFMGWSMTGRGPAAPRAPLPHPVDDLGGHVRVRLPRRGRRPGPARGRRVEPGGGVGGVHGDPGDLAVRHSPASAAARAPLGAVPGGLRLRGAAVGRLPDGLRRQQRSTP